MTTARYVIKRTANRYKIIKAGGQGRPGDVGPRGTSATPGTEITDPEIVGGEVTFDFVTHWGIDANGDAYYSDDPDDIPVEERAWWNPGTNTVELGLPPGEPEAPGGGTGDVTTQMLNDHIADKTNVHGFANTDDIPRNDDLVAAIEAHNQDTTVHGVDTSLLVQNNDSRLTDSRPPTGGAGGVLSGTYPNPGFAVDMATQAELDAHKNAMTSIHGIADSSQLADKAYVDAATAGIRPHDPVELVVTTNHSLSGLAAIDGVTPSAGWRTLVAGQTAAADNGLYIASSSGWSRASDLDATAELISGISVYVKQGSTKANTQWQLTFSGTANLGTTAQTWTQTGGGSIPADAAAGTPSLRSLGYGATQAVPGNAPELTNTRTPTDGTVTAAKFATNADIPQEQVARLTTDLEAKAPTIPRLWQPLGEPGIGGYNTAVRVSRADPQHILAAGDELGVAVYNGRTGRWYTPRGSHNNEVNDLVQHPSKLNVWWKATMGGPERSLDGGYTWELCASGLPTSGQEYFRAIGKILFDPTNDNVAYAIMGSHRPWKTSNTDVSGYGQVYKSTNMNDEVPTWTLHTTIGTDFVVRGAAIAADGLTMMAVGSFGVYKWTSASGTWSNSGITGLPGGSSVPLDVVADPTSNSTFHVAVEASGGTGGGVYKTTNAAAFTAATGLPSTSTDGYRKLDISADGTVLVVESRTTDKIHRSINSGASYSDYLTTAMLDAITRGNPAGAGAGDGLHIDPSDNTRVIVGTSDEIYDVKGSTVVSLGTRALSNGRMRGRGYNGYVTEAITPSRARKNYALFHTFDAGNTIYTEDFEGFTFPTRSLYTYGGGYGSAFGGAGGNKVMAVLGQSGTFRGIAISTDYGKTFPSRVYGSGAGLPDLDANVGVGRAAIAPLDRAGNVWLALIGGKAYRTTDFGVSWTNVGTNTLKFETLAVDESTLSANGLSTTVYYGDPSTGGGVYKSTNSGTTEALISGTPHADNTSGRVFVSFCQITRRLYVTVWQPSSSISAAQEGVWRLTGSTWARIFDDFSAKWAQPSWHDPDLIAVGTHDSPRRDVNRATGVYLSEDDGETFAKINNGLPVTNIRCGAWDPFERGRLIVGTEGRGFWSTKVSTEDFTAAATGIPEGAISQIQVAGLADTLAQVPSRTEVNRFRNTRLVREADAVRKQIGTVVRVRDFGFNPDSRVATLPRSGMNTDLSLTSGELLLFRLILFKDFWAKKLRWAVGKGTALSGSTLVRFGVYEQDATLGMTLRVATASVSSPFTTVGTTETANLSTGGSLPRTSLLKYGTDYYFGGLVVGTLSNGSWRGCDLNGTGSFEPVASYRVTGQTDLPATIASSSLLTTDKHGAGWVE